MNPPTFIPVKPRVQRKRQESVAATTPAGPPILVRYVITDDPPAPGRASWLFDGDVTLTGTPVGLTVITEDGELDPVSATHAIDGGTIDCVYDTTDTLDGKAWTIEHLVTGIAESARIPFPQDGIVISP